MHKFLLVEKHTMSSNISTRLSAFTQLPYMEQVFFCWIHKDSDFFFLSTLKESNVADRSIKYMFRGPTVLDAYLVMLPWISYNLALPISLEALFFLKDLNMKPDPDFADGICCRIFVLIFTLFVLGPIFFALFIAFGLLTLVFILVKLVLALAVLIPQALIVIPITNCIFPSNNQQQESHHDQKGSQQNNNSKQPFDF